jgi:hypothetical protein
LAKTVICKIRNLDGTVFFENIRRFCLESENPGAK